MFDTVLLPIDLNHKASWEKALPLALRCAGEGGRVHLLGVVHDLGLAMVATYLPEDYERHAMERLKEQLTAFAASNIPGAEAGQVHVGYGHVAETILRVGQTLGADLIVMASHPPSDWQTLLVGSQADKVVRHATIPVMVVR
jgi:nucleotide-binding universal stress UspA family protein